MANRVTIQDIADALGLSRNTVSKAINNTGVLAEATRQRVLAKAIEMGYKQFSYVDQKMLEKSIADPGEKNEIALLSTWFLNSSHFSSTMLDKFQLEISKAGFSMSMHIVRPEDIAQKVLPQSIHKERLAALICFEVFDYGYAEFLCSSGIPTLFVDASVAPGHKPLMTDILLMDNSRAITAFISAKAREGIKKIGFAGDYMHCMSFFERYMAFRNGMYLNGLPIDETYLLQGSENRAAIGEERTYQDYLADGIRNMTELPDVFICANDFVAIYLLHALQDQGYSVPEDVMLFGFDDSPEASLLTPKLSTVHIHSQILGFTAAQLLLSRIYDPDLNYRTVYCETSLVLRESTKD